MKKVFVLLLSSVVWLVILAVTAFGAAAIHFCAPIQGTLRNVLGIAVVVGVIGPCAFAKTWGRSLTYAGPVLIAVYGWYISIRPTLDAQWGKDVAVLPSVAFEGDLMTVRNIRDFNYRSDTDFDAVYHDRTYDLNQLESVDLFLSYWGTTDIAHTIMSFGFTDGRHLAISIETRKKVGEEYSAVLGFFKKFEIIYVVAEERDVIGVRVNHRNEDVYLYRLPGFTPEKARKMLRHYMATVDKLETTPKFYNALTTNCTTSILPHIQSVGDLKFNWALIANGHLDRWRYESGVWGFEFPFEEFRRRSHINEKAKGASESPEEFSARIRVGLPSFPADRSH